MSRNWRLILGSAVGGLLALGGPLAASAGEGNTVQYMKPVHAAKTHGGGGTANLSYHGGTGGVGVETNPAVYIVYWGAQWNGNDPSGEAAIQQRFFNGIGGTSWNASVTQYCQNVATGTTNCATAAGAVFGGNPQSVLKGVWSDNAAAAPAHPTPKPTGRRGGGGSSTLRQHRKWLEPLHPVHHLDRHG